MRPGIRAALVSRRWTDAMINEFIDNFRQKHGFNRQTAMLPYDDEGDSDEEPIELEGGRRMLSGGVSSPLTRVPRRKKAQTNWKTLYPVERSAQRQGLTMKKANSWDRRPKETQEGKDGDTKIKANAKDAETQERPQATEA